MSKKDPRNLLQQMTDAYQAALKIEDSGEQFFALQNLEKKIEESVKPSLTDEKEIEKKWIDQGGNALLIVGGLGAAAVSMLTPAAVPWYFDIVIGTGTFFGGGIAAAETLAHKIKKKYKNQNNHYVQNVMPHIPALDDLVIEIKNSMDQLLEERNLPKLQQSKELSRVVAERPELLKKFNALFQKNYDEQKKTHKNGKDNKLEL